MPLLAPLPLPDWQNDEDDATFWSRLIREDDRPKEQLAAPLGPRAARLKPITDAEGEGPGLMSRSHSPQGSDPDEDPAAAALAGRASSSQKPVGGKKPAAGSRKKRSGSSHQEPGPPVEGAALRVDEWLWEVDETGRPLQGNKVRTPPRLSALTGLLPCCSSPLPALHP
jgi:chromodomain-helicase-DNA-binding protein 1